MPSPSSHRSGEWPDLVALINSSVRQAVKQAMDGDSGFNKGTEADAAGREDMKRLVTELRSAMITSVGDVHRSLLDRLAENNTSLQSMVRIEVSSLRTTMEDNLREIKEALHQGDKEFAVLNTKVAGLQSDVDRAKDTPSSGFTSATSALRPRDESTTSTHRKKDKAEGGTTAYVPIILVAIVTAVGTTVGTWAMDLVGRGAKEAVKDAVQDTRPKPPAPLLPGPTAP